MKSRQHTGLLLSEVQADELRHLYQSPPCVSQSLRVVHAFVAYIQQPLPGPEHVGVPQVTAPGEPEEPEELVEPDELDEASVPDCALPSSSLLPLLLLPLLLPVALPAS